MRRDALCSVVLRRSRLSWRPCAALQYSRLAQQRCTIGSNHVDQLARLSLRYAGVLGEEPRLKILHTLAIGLVTVHG